MKANATEAKYLRKKAVGKLERRKIKTKEIKTYNEDKSHVYNRCKN